MDTRKFPLAFSPPTAPQDSIREIRLSLFSGTASTSTESNDDFPLLKKSISSHLAPSPMRDSPQRRNRLTHQSAINHRSWNFPVLDVSPSASREPSPTTSLDVGNNSTNSSPVRQTQPRPHCPTRSPIKIVTPDAIYTAYGTVHRRLPQPPQYSAIPSNNFGTTSQLNGQYNTPTQSNIPQLSIDNEEGQFPLDETYDHNYEPRMSNGYGESNRRDDLCQSFASTSISSNPQGAHSEGLSRYNCQYKSGSRFLASNMPNFRRHQLVRNQSGSEDDLLMGYHHAAAGASRNAITGSAVAINYLTCDSEASRKQTMASFETDDDEDEYYWSRDRSNTVKRRPLLRIPHDWSLSSARDSSTETPPPASDFD